MNTTTASLYDLDFYRWIQHQVETLRAGKFSELDLDNLIEEMEAVGRSEKTCPWTFDEFMNNDFWPEIQHG